MKLHVFVIYDLSVLS